MSATDIPKTIGRYEVVRELGRGAVGRVFLARDPRLDRHVAVKTLAVLAGLPPGEGEQARARFLREAQAAAALNHRNIVTVFDVGEDGDVPYIAMEYLEGTTLDRHTREGHLLPLPKVLEIGMQAALALDEAHRAGIVHRDIKPANIVLLRDGTVKVADFGLAKDPRTSLTSDQTLLGTPNYMSPEQIAGRDLDGRSDLFSLAVSIYEMLAGVRPFPGDTISSVLYRIVNEPGVPLSTALPNAPAGLEDFFQRALAKEPAKRPATGAVFAEEVRRILIAQGGVPADLVLPPPDAADTLVSRARTSQALRRGRGDVTRIEEKKDAPRGARRIVLTIAAMIAGLVLGGWTAPLWSGIDPLGSSRKPVEDWLGSNLGALGNALRTTAPEVRVLVESVPPGIGLLIEPETAARFEEGGVLVLPEDFSVPITLRIDDPCREGEEVLRPGFVDRTLRVESVPRRITLPIASDPPGAQVRVGDRLLAEPTPTSVEVEACTEHVIEVQVRGRTPATITLAANASQDSWRAAVANVAIAAPAEASIVVPRAPFPVRVSVSGGGRGNAGETLAAPPGRRAVTLSAPEHFYEETVTVTLDPGATERLDVRFPSLVTCSFVSYPIGAKVSLKGATGSFREIGTTGQGKVEAKVVPGSYTARFEHGTRGVVERPLSVGAGGAPASVRVVDQDWPIGGKK